LPGRAVIVLGLLAAAACRQAMEDQPRYEPLEASSFFPDGRSSRPILPGTVARGHLDDDAAPGDALPFPVTRELLDRGEERYDIFCSPCHDRVGTGDGMVVRRGYTRPPSFHIDRLREAPAGHFFEVMTQGFGAMPSYAAQVPVRDRWAITAYIRALQRSQHAALADVPASARGALEREGGE
jgi:cbb3-type cytochrome c oxidase subunit III